MSYYKHYSVHLCNETEGVHGEVEILDLAEHKSTPNGCEGDCEACAVGVYKDVAVYIDEKSNEDPLQVALRDNPEFESARYNEGYDTFKIYGSSENGRNVDTLQTWYFELAELTEEFIRAFARQATSALVEPEVKAKLLKLGHHFNVKKTP
jgi:hypothetical protein